MARASTPTLLSLDRFARIMGIAPPHFNSAVLGALFPTAGCSDTWRQHNWQANDRVSREELAQAIADAERDIATVLGYWPAPTWTSQEVIDYPQHWRRDMIFGGGQSAHGLGKSVKTRWGKVNAPGIRAVTFIDDPRVVYTDADGDGEVETATVTCATTLTDVNEIKVYFAGHSGEQEWEIRPPRSVSLSGGIFTAVFYTWQFIDPDLWEVFPSTDSIRDIDASDTVNLVSTVDVYREYNDPTAVSAQFNWGGQNAYATICTLCGGVGCAACNLITQDGCFSVVNPEAGIIVPVPGSYSLSDVQWGTSSWSVCRTPDFVKVWYYSGAIDEKWLAGRNVDPLPDHFAQAITWLAVARLHRPLCNCGNVDELVTELQRDYSITVQGKTKYVSAYLLENPLGPKTGEVRAWQKIKHLCDNLISVGVI